MSEEGRGGGPRQRAVNYNSTARSRTESPNLRARLVKILSRGSWPTPELVLGRLPVEPEPRLLSRQATSDLITAHRGIYVIGEQFFRVLIVEGKLCVLTNFVYSSFM